MKVTVQDAACTPGVYAVPCTPSVHEACSVPTGLKFADRWKFSKFDIRQPCNDDAIVEVEEKAVTLYKNHPVPGTVIKKEPKTLPDSGMHGGCAATIVQILLIRCMSRKQTD